MVSNNKTTDWPYDANRDDPLTALRIPVVGSAWPDWHYIVAFDDGRIDGKPNRPTNREAAQLQSFLTEYCDRWYGPEIAGYRAHLLERPFDIDGGANGMIFRKWGDGDWAYKRRTWRHSYRPWHPASRARGGEFAVMGPLTLVEVMDWIHVAGYTEPSARWLEWKATRPEVFGG